MSPKRRRKRSARKVGQARKIRRTYSLSADSSVGSARLKIARVFGLPPQSVKLVVPGGRTARADKQIYEFLRDWALLRK
ncbi:MAG: hypothetical protein WD802_09105 [Gemmatimonadaceae bacterium]